MTKLKNLRWRLILLILLSLILSGSMQACVNVAPAAFEVMSLDITPTEVIAGNLVNVSVEVKNVGGSQGIYTATLTVDGADIERKNVSLAPGTAQRLTFWISKDAAGIYRISVGGLSSNLTVKHKLVAKDIELKYDDGSADTISFAGKQGGYLVHFSPPVESLVVKKVRIFGRLFGGCPSCRELEVQIWDKDQNMLRRQRYSYSRFPEGSPESELTGANWVELEISDTQVDGDFYIHVYTNSPLPTPSNGGLGIGVDSSIPNEHSEGTTSYKVKWNHDFPKGTANWMIRVVGTAMVPE